MIFISPPLAKANSRLFIYQESYLCIVNISRAGAEGLKVDTKIVT